MKIEKFSKMLAYENLKIFGKKVKLGKLSTKSEKYFGNRERNLKQGENA